MSRFLHLRAFTGRPSTIAPHIAAHAINPALQPMLSCIPALTLVESYAQAERYSHTNAFRTAARTIAGNDLASMLEGDMLAFRIQDSTV